MSAAGQRPGHQPLARLGRVGGGADRRHHLVDVGDRDGEAAEDVRPLAGLAELEGGAAGDHLLAEGDEGGEEGAEVELLGPAAVQRQHVAAEARLQRREAEELVQHHVGRGVAAELDDDAHAEAVALVLDVGDALDALVAGELGDALDHRRLVHLVGDLGDDDRGAAAADLLDAGARADDHRAAALVVGLARAGAAEDERAGREVGRRDELHQLGDGELGVLDQRQRRVDHLAEVVRRDVGRHADGDAAGAVDQHVGEARRQDGGLEVLAVVVRLEVDGVLVDVGEQVGRRLRHAHLGVAHGRRLVAVHRAEVALPVEQRQRHREVLRHPHQRVVDRLVAVRVVLAHDVADGARRLAVGLVVGVAGLVHRVEDAPVHRLQPVAQVGDRPADDHAHRVVEVGGSHLRLDGHGGPEWRHPRRLGPVVVAVVFGGVASRGNRSCSGQQAFDSVYIDPRQPGKGNRNQAGDGGGRCRTTTTMATAPAATSTRWRRG